jgi:excisionase family DNA binding protein
MIEDTWTVDDVSKYLKVPKQTLYQWRTRGYGPEGHRVGKYIRYDPADVVAWFKARRQVA